jgi:phosphatidate cytidylyltransferase
MLKERIATAVVVLAVFLSALFLLPTRQFAVVVAGVVGVGAFEWAALTKVSRGARYAFSAFCAALFGIGIWGLQVIDPSRPEVAAMQALSVLFWIGVVPFWLWRDWKMRSRPVALAVGAAVVLPAGFAVVSLHSIAPYVLLMVLALVWIADVAAYFAGRAFGRHKLAPKISPGKTWEGVAGAMVATTIYAIICVMVSPQLSAIVKGGYWVLCFGGAALLCAVSIVGDLFESLMKRQASVKDSGTFLPGHGGVLDRIDSVTSTLPTAAFLFFLIAGGP